MLPFVAKSRKFTYRCEGCKMTATIWSDIGWVYQLADEEWLERHSFCNGAVIAYFSRKPPPFTNA